MSYSNEELGYEVVERGDEKGHGMPASLAASTGWFPLPKTKLPFWDPDNEKQWHVSSKTLKCMLAWKCLQEDSNMSAKKRERQGDHSLS